MPGKELETCQDGNDEMLERPPVLPYFNLINNHLKTQKNSLTRNSRISLRAFKDSKTPGEFYLESEIEKHQISQRDINSPYFVGFKNPEDKIKPKLKMTKKLIVSNEGVGSFFKVSLVTENQMQKILTFEAYSNALKQFMRVLQCMFRKNKKISPALFQIELLKVLQHSQNLKNILNSIDTQSQILGREFKILDMTTKFLYYFFVSSDIELVLVDRKFEMTTMIQFLKNLSVIILNSTKDNELTHIYISQYIRTFIHALFNPSPFFKACTKSQSNDLKDHIVRLLYRFLWDKDLDTLGQLNYYEESFFKNFDEHSDYSIHLLQLMNHYCRSKAPNLVNSLRENFINDYLTDPVKIAQIFPRISTSTGGDFEITLTRQNYPNMIALNTDTQEEIQDYVIWTFKLINSIAEIKSLKFWSIIINYYNEGICEELVSSKKVPSKIKNEVLITLKTIHFGYGKLPFDAIPPKIQIVLTSDKFKAHIDSYEQMVNLAKSNVVGDLEASIIETKIRRVKSTSGISIENMTVDILKNEYASLKKGNLDSLQFTLQVMKNVLQDDKTLTNESLYIIHHSLSEIMDKAVNELFNKKQGPYLKPFSDNFEAIFRVLKEVDYHTVRLAFKEAINDIKDKVLKKSAASKILTIISPIAQTVGATYSALENEIIGSVINSMTDDWKSKKKLYELAGQKNRTDIYTEQKVINLLWKIVERGTSGLANAAVNLIKTKTNFETNITKELAGCSLLDEEIEVTNYIKLASSLLELNKVGRRIQAKLEFGFDEKEDESTLDIVIENLEKILLIIYDYTLHLSQEDPSLNEERAREVFLERFRYSKIRSKQEIPFKYKPQCIKNFYQKVLRMLQTQEIIIPFIKYLYEKTTFGDVNEDKIKLGYTLIMVITTLFVHDNPENQILLSTYPDFITIFYSDIESISVEAILMFAEMCNNNKKLLQLSEDYLFNVTIYTFVEYLNPFTIKNAPGVADSSVPINFIRSLSYLLSADIPDDMFNSAEFMTEKFLDLYSFMKDDRRISLSVMLENNKSSATDDLKKLILSQEEDYLCQYIMLDMPVFYSILKELLEAEAAFALTEVKERVLTLHGSFTLEKLMPFISNENVEFNFELKRLTLEMLENLYFKNLYKNTNIFYNYDKFSSAVTYLLIDVYGYLRNHISSDDTIFKMFDTAYFNSDVNIDYIGRYNRLLKTNLDNIIYFQYQSIVLFKDVWKEYIFYLLCNFFGCLIFYVKDFVLLDKEKDRLYHNIFEVWLDLILTVRRTESDPVCLARIDVALKNAIILSDYSKYRQRIYDMLEKASEYKPITVKPKQQDVFQLDLEKILASHFGERSTYKLRYTEINLNEIAFTLGSTKMSSNKPVLKRLIGVLAMHETPLKDVIFILKLFRKLIETENSNDDNKNLPIYLWTDVSSMEFKRIHHSQIILNEIKIVDAIFDLFYKYEKNKAVMKEILLLCIALLYGGNRTLQDAFYEYFKLDYDNEILDNFACILEQTLESFNIKQKKNTSKAYFKTLQFIFDFMIENKNFSLTTGIDNVDIPNQFKSELASKYYEEHTGGSNSDSIPSEDYTLLCIILKFLQTLCEGHYLNFQEFLRDQSLVDHHKSSNIPEFLSQAYHSYYRYLNVENVEVGTKILELLIELEQGEVKPNVQLLLKKTFISDICNTLNGYNSDLDLLTRGFGFNASHTEFMELKSKALILLKDLVERSEQSDLKKISRYINNGALVSTLKDNIIAFHHKKKIYPEKQDLYVGDIWDSNLANAFMVYFILRHLSFDQTKDDFTPEIQETLEEILYDNKDIDRSIAHKYLTRFFKKYTGSIEIIQKTTSGSRLMRIYFPITVVYDYLKLDTQETFSDKADRSNTQSKIADLMDTSEELIKDMYVDYNSRNRLFGLNFNNMYKALQLLSNIFALTITIFNLFHLQYNNDEQDVVYKHDNDKDVQIGLNAFQSCINFILLILWLNTKLHSNLTFKWNDFCNNNTKERGSLSPDILSKLDQKNQVTYDMAVAVLELRGPYSDEFEYVKHLVGQRLFLYNFIFTVKTSRFVWHVIYLAVCIGSSFHPVVAAFQLLDIVIRSDSVTRIAKAVTRNATQFFWTLVLLLVTVYIYSFIGLYFLNRRYKDDDGYLCADAYACFLASLNQGLRSGGGIADAIKSVPYDPESKWNYFLNTLYDLSFFILIITLLLNLIFGMIIDAFGELRDEKNANDEDKLNVCFICGLERSEYERIGNFDKHTSEEHNMWQYVAYIVYLQEKEKSFSTDMTDIESYVAECYHKKDYSWMPVGRSLTLERETVKEVEEKSEVTELREELTEVLDKIMTQNKDLAVEVQELRSSLNKPASDGRSGPRRRTTWRTSTVV